MQVSDCLIEENKSIKGNYWDYQKPSINLVEKIKLSFNLSNIIASIVANRNIDDKNLDYFLNPTLKNNYVIGYGGNIFQKKVYKNITNIEAWLSCSCQPATPACSCSASAC